MSERKESAKPAAEAPKPKRVRKFTPYPGLNYYTGADADLFAGRTEDISACVRTLSQSRVMVLHGPTGCGKSSFLRAGVKPHLATVEASAHFAGKPGEFEVIRSTEAPLERFMAHCAGIVRTIRSEIDQKARKRAFGPLNADVDFAKVEARFANAAQLKRSAMNAYFAYRALIDALQNRLMLVVDQGEEVFTLNDERRVRDEMKRAGKSDAEIATEVNRRVLETAAYFEFLRKVAADGPGPIVVSLRTEYKGQFDDRIAGRAGHPGVWLKGYYLEALGKPALIEAIRRPTLGDSEWEKLVEDGKVASKVAPGRANKFLIEFPEAEADYLAGELLKGDAVPPGGVLPALQIACKRIYDQAREAAPKIASDDAVRVTRSSIMRLGAIANQVEEFLSECIEKACQQKKLDYDRKSLTEGQLIDLVHRALANTLVQVEPDGRAVTRRMPNKEFRAGLKKLLGDRLAGLDDVLRRLVQEGLLRKRDVNDRAEDDDDITADDLIWSLGHDSIALALNKWRTKFGRDEGSMMRMMMGTAHQPAAWVTKDLYPADDKPSTVKLAIPRDFLWDRQLLHFVVQKGFAERLGFDIDAPEALDATKIEADEKGDRRKGPPTWFDLAQRVRGIQDDPKDARIPMVSAEWGAFPLVMRDETTDKFNPDAPGMKELDPRDYAASWTDLCSSNINVGNGLIGPELRGADGKPLRTASDIERESDGRDVEGVRTAIRQVLLRLADSDVGLRVFDLRAKRLLFFAADLVFNEQEDALRDKVKARLDKAKSFTGEKYAVRDPVVAWLMAQQDRKAVLEARDRQGGDNFVVAGAFPRAMAMQAGLKVHFGAKHIAALAREEMMARKQETDRAEERKRNAVKPLANGQAPAPAPEQKRIGYASNVRDLAAKVQDVISHTLWQVGIEGANWENGADRARTLRLASLGYYATDYARTSMDEFVAFLQDFANTFLDHDLPGKDSLRGVRLSRQQVRDTVAECFSFVRFEANTEDVFDLDAPFAYWSDHGALGAKSVAQAIYQELMALRQRTLDHFDSCVGAISWLRYKERYYPKLDKAVSDAYELKEYAWRHFRIFNFYDAERFMSRAASLLTRRLETITDAEAERMRVVQQREDEKRAT